MKLINPLNYPLAVLAGGITLVIGVRLLEVSNTLAIPSAIAVATGLAFPLSSKEAARINLDNPALNREIVNVRQQANILVEKAESLRSEAKSLLTNSSQLELLAAVEYACDRVIELPQKIEGLARKLQSSDSLLSPTELQQQISAAKIKQQQSSGVAKEQLTQLISSLENNLELARQGQDTRQAQVISLNTLVTQSAGVLQQLQNRLRNSNLNNVVELDELRELSAELNSIQESVALFFSR